MHKHDRARRLLSLLTVTSLFLLFTSYDFTASSPIALHADGAANTVSVRIGRDNDDAEEEGPDGANPGTVHQDSSDLELVEDIEPVSYGTQTIGLRFRAIDIPQGETIHRADITFLAVAADPPNTNDGPSNLLIAGEDSSDPQAYADTLHNISSRTPTDATVSWSPPPWDAGASYTTPDLSTVVQEIVNRADWSTGSDMAFIITGSGSRSAASYDGAAAYAPLLRIEWGESSAEDVGYLPFVQSSDAVIGRLLNGNFEEGPAHWSQYSSNGFPLIYNDFSPVGITPHSGIWGAWLGGFSDETSILSQQVIVPLPDAPLRYWHWIASADQCGYDRAWVRVNGAEILEYALCGSTETDGWVQQSIDLSPYAGQEVTIQIGVETNGASNSNLFVDDIGFGMQYPSVTVRANNHPEQEAKPGLSAPSRPKGTEAKMGS